MNVFTTVWLLESYFRNFTEVTEERGTCTIFDY